MRLSKNWAMVITDGIVMAPNYLTANNLKDMSEVKSSVFGMGGLAVLIGIFKLFGISVKGDDP